jgi:predicted Zn-dependent protease
MFAAHKELPDVIAQWFAATLMDNPGSAPKTDGSAFEPQVLSALKLMDQPGGAGEVDKMLAQARERDPGAEIFPEFVVNLLGYEHIQLGDTKGAVEILRLNATAYPSSPNVYDSLSDAYRAAGQKDLALQNAKMALALLSDDKTDTEQRRNAIRESAEQKLKQLDKPNP